MLVPSRRSRLLPFLLFLTGLSARSVRGQQVVLSKASSNYVEVTWNKVGAWFGVNSFQVTITTPVFSCTKDVTCIHGPCTFNSKVCGSLRECSDNSLTVSDGFTPSDPVPFQTAPAPVTDLDVQVVEGVLHISWTNPSIESSTCYFDTVVRTSGGRFVNSTTFHPVMEESLAVPLCEANSGSVKVWTRGGNGGSEVTNSVFDYTGDDVIGLVTAGSCQAEGCSDIEVAWDYNPVCPNVTHICVAMEGIVINCTEDTATTSLRVTGLEVGTHYFSISAYGQDVEISDPAYLTCSTHDSAVTNLEAVGRSPTSVNVTWDPPTCLSAKSLMYEVTINRQGCEYSPDQQDTTSETNYTWTHLEEFTKYYVCVATEDNQEVGKAVYTLPRRPSWLHMKMVGDESVFVEWEEIVYDGFTSQYRVTWGSEVGYTDVTKHTIKGYNSTEALGVVCVAVSMELDDSCNATGPPICSVGLGQEEPVTPQKDERFPMY